MCPKLGVYILKTAVIMTQPYIKSNRDESCLEHDQQRGCIVLGIGLFLVPDHGIPHPVLLSVEAAWHSVCNYLLT